MSKASNYKITIELCSRSDEWVEDFSDSIHDCLRLLNIPFNSVRWRKDVSLPPFKTFEVSGLEMNLGEIPL